ncbi:MFS transporter [Leeuwenhoekiella marinoflava]|uniref:DHA1 family arabinose polymer transporter-like MFS transporter n=2 Tax=Leeuwenhoekiella marinoflava TaxID=988 RepID=A0A4Q0PJT5_9FLAO|nr:MFS transporter [Leeuwenhoekiella marinoflava]RXG27037.1 DHA1 family arabinose polymer transporter-like MFS transporter [Leeuwenhoekiella marinoflava]SHF42630.1 MFS transporter, DHA1 family, arabinose polymer transporter [Leeuwenhoekiella marinoflava DSM 3653]
MFKKSLIALAIGGFGIGMTEFVMMGILPDVAKDLNVTIPQAGHFISAYALGVVIGAPILVAIAGNYPPKKILFSLMIGFTVFNSFSVFASSYGLMLISRLLSGLPHGAFFGVGAVVASRLVPKEKAASAVAMMFSGLTIANIIGIPLGTYVGHNISWRYTFMIVVAVGLVTVLAIKFWLPNIEKSEPIPLKQALKIFKRTELWLILAITAVGTGGFFAWYSYITPLLTDVSGFDSDMVIFILMLAGLGMTFGNVLGGKLADKFSPIKATALLLSVMSLCLITISLIAPIQWAMLLMVFVTGAFAFSTAPSIQMLMIKSAKESEMLASSVNQAAFNIANAVGAFLGGLPIAAGYGYTSPELVGACLAFGGVLLSISVIVLRKKRAKLALEQA